MTRAQDSLYNYNGKILKLHVELTERKEASHIASRILDIDGSVFLFFLSL